MMFDIDVSSHQILYSFRQLRCCCHKNKSIASMFQQCKQFTAYNENKIENDCNFFQKELSWNKCINNSEAIYYHVDHETQEKMGNSELRLLLMWHSQNNKGIGSRNRKGTSGSHVVKKLSVRWYQITSYIGHEIRWLAGLNIHAVSKKVIGSNNHITIMQQLACGTILVPAHQQ